MSSQHYIVSQDGTHWKISFHGTDQGPFKRKNDAIAAAIEAAESEGGGADVEVLVQDVDFKFHTAWRAGRPAQSV
jgi:hypothetical protein